VSGLIVLGTTQKHMFDTTFMLLFIRYSYTLQDERLQESRHTKPCKDICAEELRKLW